MFIIHRKGKLETSFDTDNQCKEVGWKHYYYHVTIATKKRDKQNFVIDHERLDTIIQEIVINGSCESIVHEVYKAVSREMKGIQAFKCTVSPTQHKGPSYMEYVWFNKKDVHSYKYLCIMNDNDVHFD